MNHTYLKLLLASLALVSTSAFAGNNSNNSDTVNNYYNTTNSPQGGRADSDASANAIAGASSNASSSVGVINSTTVKTDVDTSQGQLQGQGQIQGQSNSQTITVQASKSYRPPVSSAYAATVFPTAPCMGSSSGGATGTLISLSLASSWESKDCMALETARSFEQAGYSEDAMHIRCSSKYAKDAPSCKALEASSKTIATDLDKPANKALFKRPESNKSNSVEDKTSSNLIIKPELITYSDNGYYSNVTNPLAQ